MKESSKRKCEPQVEMRLENVEGRIENVELVGKKCCIFSAFARDRK